MRRMLILIVFVAVGCASRTPATPSLSQRATEPAGLQQTPSLTPTPTLASMPDGTGEAAAACPFTSPTDSPPTDTDVFGGGPGAEWYCSPDRALCAVKNGPWPAGGWKVGWRKPAGAKLVVTGRRLDADAPPLRADVPDGYHGTFQASGLLFPTAGCWEVSAQAAGSTVHFVVTVEPPPPAPR
jgi:hypothetical protein